MRTKAEIQVFVPLSNEFSQIKKVEHTTQSP